MVSSMKDSVNYRPVLKSKPLEKQTNLEGIPTKQAPVRKELHLEYGQSSNIQNFGSTGSEYFEYTRPGKGRTKDSMGSPKAKGKKISVVSAGLKASQ